MTPVLVKMLWNSYYGDSILLNHQKADPQMAAARKVLLEKESVVEEEGFLLNRPSHWSDLRTQHDMKHAGSQSLHCQNGGLAPLRFLAVGAATVGQLQHSGHTAFGHWTKGTSTPAAKSAHRALPGCRCHTPTRCSCVEKPGDSNVVSPSLPGT